MAGSLMIAMWGVIALVKDNGAAEPQENEATVPQMILNRRKSYELEHRDSEFDAH